MRVFIAGVDGYLGWPLALALADRGHEVGGCDIGLRRQWVEEMGSWSAIPIASIEQRVGAFEDRFGTGIHYWNADLRDYSAVETMFRSFAPDAIVHLGECPSAPYSMMDVDHTSFVQSNNIVGTLNILYAMRDACPSAHLVKLGTMGEYGTPNVDIPEGFFTVEYRGRTDTLPFPRQPGSWYHLSKVHDSHNVQFACRVWGLSSTDIMQGVVFGTQIDRTGDDARLFTRLDFDQAFGTAVNRFCCQSVIGHPLTLFGKGGQRRGFLPLRDSMQCIAIAIENPPEAGEYRVFNQFEEVYGVDELAEKVKIAGSQLGLEVEVQHIENPRKEAEEHYYNPDHSRLLDLGYRPTQDMASELVVMLSDLMRHRDRIEAKRDVLIPNIRWDGTRRKSTLVEKVRAPSE